MRIESYYERERRRQRRDRLGNAIAWFVVGLIMSGLVILAMRDFACPA